MVGIQEYREAVVTHIESHYVRDNGQPLDYNEAAALVTLRLTAVRRAFTELIAASVMGDAVATTARLRHK